MHQFRSHWPPLVLPACPYVFVDEHLLEAVVREEPDSCFERVARDEGAYARVEPGDPVSSIGRLGDGPQSGRLSSRGQSRVSVTDQGTSLTKRGRLALPVVR